MFALPDVVVVARSISPSRITSRADVRLRGRPPEPRYVGDLVVGDDQFQARVTDGLCGLRNSCRPGGGSQGMSGPGVRGSVVSSG